MTPQPANKKQRSKPRKHQTHDFMGWKIRRFTDTKWQSDNVKFDGGKRERHFHDSLEKAKGYIADRQGEISELGNGAFALSAAQREEVLQAYRDLDGRSTVRDAVAFWLYHHPSKKGATLGEQVEGWLREADEDGLAPTSIRQMRQRMKTFSEVLGVDKPCSVVTPSDVSTFLAGRDCGKKTKQGWQKTLHAFFEFCKEGKAIMDNPVVKRRKARRGIKTVEEVSRKIPILPPRTVERFLHKLEELHPESVPALAIAFFAGLRPFEIQGQYSIETSATTAARRAVELAAETLENATKRGTAQTIAEAETALAAAREAFSVAREQENDAGFFGGLTWQNVNLAGRFIRVEAETSKTRVSRLVEIPDNLLVWLMKHLKADGQVSTAPITLKRHRQEAMKAIGLKEWPVDVARHCYATYHFAAHQNRDKLAAQMGHSGGSGVLEKHYKGLATAEEAARFWAILPAGAKQQSNAQKEESAQKRA